MADRGDTHYRVRNLNLWFTFSSLLLLIASVWMMWDDFDAEWKPYQQEFRAIDARLTRAKLEGMTEELEAERVAKAEVDQARQAFASRQADLDAGKAELFELEGRLDEIDRQLKIIKGENNWDKYVQNEENIHYWADGEDRARMPKALAEMNPGFSGQFEREYQKEQQQAKVDAKKAELAAMTANLDAAELVYKAASKDLELLRSKLDKLEPEDAEKKLANVLRDFPGLDFVDPRNKILKVVSPEIKLDLNFTKKPRIDMCMTCHLGIDRAGFENEPQPYTTHPRLDLFLTATSPHALKDVGCTSCHRGSGEALSFQRSDHRPSGDAERDEWRAEHHWHKQHHWDWPMLTTAQTEAGCVQCHQTSMELIAEDAPLLSEGYQLFESSGCYSCHKVEWFPTSRKRGPSLKNLAAKFDRQWADAWIAKPKDFRPTTRMPQIFHLENFGAEDVVVLSEYGQGREILGQEWNDTAVAAVTAYLFDNAPLQPFPEPPVEGDAERGREMFRVSGCLACHNVAPYEAVGDPGFDAADLALVPRETNEMGPNLRGVAAKVNRNWLYAWVKDPTAYWEGTRMPNLRLSEQEAADITAYIMEDPEGWFHDVPDTWQPADSPYDRDVLVEQARWFFNRIGRTSLANKLEGEWSDDGSLLYAVGERFVMNQGCFSCHEIRGMEQAMPIGAELTTWGSKTVDKLDYGFMAELLGEQHGWDHHQKEEFKQYREGWLGNKLHQPRSYDRLQIKNPLEKLKMPYFGFTESEVQALTTFVIGLVNDDVGGAKMTPSADQVQMDTGQRAVRQKNCAACHVLEPGQVEFTGEDGLRHTVSGEILALDEDVLPPPMGALERYVAAYEESWEEEVDEFIVRLQASAPDFGEAGNIGDTVIVPRTGTVVTPAHGGDFVPLITKYYLTGLWNYDHDPDVAEGDEVALMPDPDGEGAVEDVDGEFRYYGEEPYDKVRWTFAPPVLLDEGTKLQKDWFYSFLNDPVRLREQMRVRMPSFNWDEGEAGAVADYFALKAERDWPERYARGLRMALGLTVEEMATSMGSKPEIVEGLEAGVRHNVASNMGPLLELGRAVGLAPAPSTDPARNHPDEKGEPEWTPIARVDPDHSRLLRREPGYLDQRMAEVPDLYATADQLARKGPNCFQCHWYKGEPPLGGEALPIAWAPDLYRVQERIREDWAHQWIKNPLRIYPGTAMPANFSSTPPAYLEFYPDSTNEQQIQVILDWVFNMDRADFRN